MEKAIQILVLTLFFHNVFSNQYPEYIGPSSKSFREDVIIGEELFTFSVSDIDDDPLSVAINYDRTFQLTETSSNQYRVSLKQQVDREEESRYSLMITIDDSQGGVLRQEVRIRLTDVNDYTPVFKNLPLIAYIRENQPEGTYVLNVTAEDEDSGFNAAVEITLTDSSLPFYLGDPATKAPIAHSYGSATILLKRSLDFEVNRIFLVGIKVTDNAGCAGSNLCQPPLSSNQTLIVNVIDVQDTPPYFTGIPYYTTTNENLPTDTQIFTVTAHDGDGAHPRDIKYYFVNTEGQTVSQTLFYKINENSGVITNSAVIDTDDTSLSQTANTQTLTVIAREVLQSDEIFNPDLHQTSTLLTITLNDLNDNRPRFSTSTRVNTSLPENSPPGTHIMFTQNITVADPDQGRNGTISLTAINLDGTVSQYFTVNPSTAVNQATISVTVKSSLDYESQQILNFKIQAAELSTGETTSLLLSVRLLDVNDNRPVFSQSVYTGYISENSMMNSVVEMNPLLNVVDLDSGEFGIVSYRLSNGYNKFAINNKTGEVYTTCSDCLDREAISAYYLDVIASDRGGLTDSCQLVVVVTDVNDNRPMFSQSVYNVFINESTQPQDNIARLQILDLDDEMNSYIQYDILTYSQYFTVINASVSLDQILDAEILPPLFDVIIRARDSGNPSLSTNCTLRVHVVDINDNSPTFSQSSHVVQIRENSRIGDEVLTLTADDADKTTPNNLMTYEITSGDYGDFIINPQTGRITVFNHLNREADRNEYSLTVRATDRGKPARSAIATVGIKVTDVNDEPPSFSKSIYRFTISESTSVGSNIGQVKASDPDSTSNVNYRITGTEGVDADGNDMESVETYLTVDRLSGNITIIKPLDRETTSKIILFIDAQDMNGLSPQVVTCLVEVILTDINDTPPRISPVQLLTLTENSAPDPERTINTPTPVERTVITQVHVNDQDIINNIEFVIQNNPYGIFEINEQGELSQILSIDREVVGNWINLTVIVYDDLSGGLSSSIDIPIYVRDLNDNQPEFTIFQSSLAIPEDIQPSNTAITIVKATDADFLPDFSTVHYRITNGSLDKFAINRITGEVRVVDSLDRDVMSAVDSTYSLVIEACDNGIPAQCNSRTMNIRITDINDNQPIFSAELYSATISEMSQLGDEVTDIDFPIGATDIDQAPNGQNVEYSCCVPTNDTEKLFSINSAGRLIVSKSLNGKIGVYNLTVTASDWGTRRQSGHATVIVRITDYNDHEPIIRVTGDRGTTVHMPENSTIGAAVISLYTLDDDVGVNGQTDFTFITNQPALSDYKYFYIQQTSHNTAAIKQNITYDVEQKQSTYRIGVRAHDRGVPQLSSSTLIITINIDNINDNRPYFSTDSLTYKITVTENEQGRQLGQVNWAQDADGREIFCYHIVGGRLGETNPYPVDESLYRTLFNINYNTAEISLRPGASLDRELSPVYVIVIQADDSDRNVYSGCNSPPNTAWVSRRYVSNQMEVVISVQDVIDSPPVFNDNQIYVAAVRDRSTGIIAQLNRYVIDADINQDRTFSHEAVYEFNPTNLRSQLNSDKPVTITPNGEIRSNIIFTDSMKGVIKFRVIATDSEGFTGSANVNVLIVNEYNLAEITLARDIDTVYQYLPEIKSSFSSNSNWTIGIESIKQTSINSVFTTLVLYVFPHDDPGTVVLGEDIIRAIDENSELNDEFYKYGRVVSQEAQYMTPQPTTEDGGDNSGTTLIILIVLASVSIIVMLSLIVICFVIRNKYKRKLKAAHAMAFDTHTLGFEIDQSDLNQSNPPPGTIQHKKPSDNPAWEKNNHNLNNFDWGTANGGFDSESNRSHHSVDDNAVDPLNSAETQSCSSGGSNDWRLDIRGNNVGCTPPPPPVIDIDDPVISAVLKQHNVKPTLPALPLHNSFENNLMNASSPVDSDRKFTDSGSDRSSLHKDSSHFNRLIMSDSSYGKIYETRKMPNGLETTEV